MFHRVSIQEPFDLEARISHRNNLTFEMSHLTFLKLWWRLKQSYKPPLVYELTANWEVNWGAPCSTAASSGLAGFGASISAIRAPAPAILSGSWDWLMIPSLGEQLILVLVTASPTLTLATYDLLLITYLVDSSASVLSTVFWIDRTDLQHDDSKVIDSLDSGSRLEWTTIQIPLNLNI